MFTNKPYTAYIWSILLFIFFLFYSSVSDASLIKTVLSKKDSFVHINAYHIETKNNTVKRSYKAGAGAIIDKKGYIITNLHILAHKPFIQVTLNNGRKYAAKLIGILAESDLALIKIDADISLKPIALANSNRVKLNSRVIHIGNSHFTQNTIAEGKVTGIGQKNNKSSTAEVFQVNLNLYEGDSGGPLLNTKGQLIGIISAQLRSQNRKAFAIPSNKIKKIYSKYNK